MLLIDNGLEFEFSSVLRSRCSSSLPVLLCFGKVVPHNSVGLCSNTNYKHYNISYTTTTPDY